MNERSSRAFRASPDKPTLSAEALEQHALAYLNRFDCSSRRLKQHLSGRVRRAGGHPQADVWIDDLLQRYARSGLLDDARFAANLAAHLAARGKSRRAITRTLLGRGVPSEIASALMSERQRDAPEAELAAALVYVRKRRLGPYRGADERDAFRFKDWAALARQGFSAEIARRALGPGGSTDEEF